MRHLNTGNSVTSIGQYAFYNNQLSSVTIPNSVTYIEQYAFLQNQLISVTIEGSDVAFGSGVLGGCFDGDLDAVYTANSAGTYTNDGFGNWTWAP